jgi:hypothetical protein
MRDSHRKTAIIVGVLFIAGTVAGSLSVLVSNPIMSAPDSLSQVAANANRLMLGAILILVMGFALAFVPIVIYPVLRRQNESLAVGYVVFRGALETVMYIGMAVCWLLLVPVSKEFASAGAESASCLQSLGDLLMGAHSSINHMLIIVFSLGALMLYSVLYQSRLIPRWLSVWGLIAILMHFSTAFILMFGLLDEDVASLWLLNFPIFLQEMVMAVWLSVKGFNPAAITSESASLMISAA